MFRRLAARALASGATVLVATAAVVIPTATPAFANPSNTVAPALSAGLAVVGTAISTDDGTWTGNGSIAYDYQWQVCDEFGAGCSNVGADANSYTPQHADATPGATIKVTITATDNDGPTSQDSNLVDLVEAPSNTVAPAVIGTLAEGRALEADFGAWSGTQTDSHPLTFHYQWLRCDPAGFPCVAIGTDADALQLTSDEVGKKIKLVVTAINDGGSASQSSALSAIVTTGSPIIAGVAYVSGTAKRGDTLTAGEGDWLGTAPITFTNYLWQQCDSAGDNCTTSSHDANQNTYLLDSSDLGSTIRVVVTAHNAVGDTDTTSTQSSVVALNPPANTSLPFISSGNPAVGSQMTVDHGTWDGISPITYDYQWERCDGAGNNCVNIDGATDSTYTVQDVDLDATLRVLVSASNADGAAGPEETSASDPISPIAPIPTSLPAITGTPTRGQTLTAVDATWVGTQPIASAFSWRRCDGTGNNCTTEVGTAGTYQLTLADVGHRMRLHVSATNSSGQASIDSFPTTVVGAAVPDAPAAPTVTRGDTQISVAFTAPADDGGSAILDYTATCASSNGGAGNNITGATSPIVVTGLTNNKTYTCTVSARNATGSGADSSPSENVVPSTTAPAVPDAPTIGAVVGSTGQIQVAFTPSANNNGSTILNHKATCTSSNGGASGNQTGAGTPITVTGLTNGKTYTCTVLAHNAIGDSAPSAASAPVVLTIAPANTAPPRIIGTVIVQRTLAAGHGQWTGAPAPTFTYQWQRCDAHGHGCTNIAHATKRTYVLTFADTDHRLRMLVTATNAGGARHQASAVTNLVKPVPVATSGPYFWDGAKIGDAGAGVVGTASRGSTVWTTTAIGAVTGPHFAPHGGTLVGIPLAKPIVGMQVTPTGKGYWLFATDGGVFGFGDAKFYGSTGNIKLNSPIIAMAATPTGKGYWLFAADGGVFGYGDAHFYGSTASRHLTHPVVAMLATPSGHGYWIVTADGQAFHFGDAPDMGNVAKLGRADIVGVVSTGNGFRFVTRTLQLLAPV